MTYVFAYYTDNLQALAQQLSAQCDLDICERRTNKRQLLLSTFNSRLLDGLADRRNVDMYERHM